MYISRDRISSAFVRQRGDRPKSKFGGGSYLLACLVDFICKAYWDILKVYNPSDTAKW